MGAYDNLTMRIMPTTARDTAVSAPIALSPAEVTACWDALGLDLPPAQLTGVAPGNGFGRRARTVALAALAARGLCDGAAPGPELAGPLCLLAHPRYRLDLRWGDDRRGLVIGLGAVAGDRGAMVTNADGRLTVAGTDGARVAGALLALRGPVTAGVGRTLNVMAGDGPRRGPGVIGVHLADAGWFAHIRRPGAVTICPADPGRLLRRCRDLIDTAAVVRPVG